MSDAMFHFSKKTERVVEELKRYYGFTTKSEVITKALNLLQLAAIVDANDAKLVAKKGDKERGLQY